MISETYVNAHSKIKLTCGICGEIYDVSPNHLVGRNAVVCPKCSLIEKGKKRRIPLNVVKSEFIKSKLTPLFDTYNGYSDPLKCLDAKGNICYITYATLYMWNRNGYSTYLPHHSRYESMVNEYLISIHAIFLKEYTFPDCKDVRRLKFDFAIFKDLENKVPNLLIEVDGQQHFKPVRFKKMNENDVNSNFENIKRRDLIKDEYCLSKGIKLLRISYFDMENGKYKEKIKNEILQNITE